LKRRAFITVLGAAGVATVLPLPRIPHELFTRTAVFFPAEGAPVWRSFRAPDINDAQDLALDWLRAKYAHRDDRIEIHNDGGPGGIYA
jgi:hypothetical protein